jgi:hypothetical protein
MLVVPVLCLSSLLLFPPAWSMKALSLSLERFSAAYYPVHPALLQPCHLYTSRSLSH